MAGKVRASRSRSSVLRRPVGFLAAGALLAAFLRLVSQPPRAAGRTAFSAPGRRKALAAAGAGTLGCGNLLLPASPSYAQQAPLQQAWQLKLPRSWRMFEQNEQPPPEVKMPATLVVAGNMELGADLVVLRVPLSTAAGDPNAPDNKALIDYFTTPAGKTPTVPIEKAINGILVSQKGQMGLQRFQMIRNPSEKAPGKRRYINYDFEDSICPGVVQQGVKGSSCTNPEDGSTVPFFDRRHGITITVTDEGAIAAGQKDPTYYLWLLDISGPLDATKNDWGDLAQAVKEIANSFELGDEEKLETKRNQTIESQSGFFDTIKEQGIEVPKEYLELRA